MHLQQVVEFIRRNERALRAELIASLCVLSSRCILTLYPVQLVSQPSVATHPQHNNKHTTITAKDQGVHCRILVSSALTRLGNCAVAEQRETKHKFLRTRRKSKEKSLLPRRVPATTVN